MTPILSSVMSGRLREIARQTVEIAEAGFYTHPVTGVQRLAPLGETQLYVPDVPIALTGERNADPRVEVTHESTLKAAARAGDQAVCLNFASAKNPGGGFLGGAKAQEESLARASSLYLSLLEVPEFYAFHRAQRDLRYSDRVIYSQGISVFRDDKGALLEEPYVTSFLTSAAPNLGAILRNTREHADSVPEVLHRRAIRVLEVAAAHGHRTVVLGAWGCGVFRNDPAVVAEAFREALKEVDRFDHVIFAIYDHLSGTPVYQAFADAFRP